MPGTNVPVPTTVYRFGSPDPTITVASQGVNKEDLLDQIVNIDPFDTPWVSQAPKTTCKHVLHQWLTDTLGSAVDTSTAHEGADWAHDDVNGQPVRQNNWTVILRQDIGATETQRAVDSAGFADVYAYEMQKATKRLAIKLEKMVFAPTNPTSGANNTARVMKTLHTFTTSNTAFAGQNPQGQPAGANGGSPTPQVGSASVAGQLTSGDFTDMLEKIYKAGGNPEQVYVSPKVKRQISAFTVIGAAANTPYSRNIAAMDKKLVSSIDFYDTDFGIIQIVLDRWVPEATANTGITSGNTDVTGSAFFLQRAMNRLAWLRPMTHQFIGKRGDAVAGIVVGECTLEVLNEKANGIIKSINQKSSVTS